MKYKLRKLSGDSGFEEDFSRDTSIQHAYVEVAKKSLLRFLSFAESDDGLKLLKKLPNSFPKPEKIEAIQRLNGKSNGWKKDLEDINSTIGLLQEIVFDVSSNDSLKKLRRDIAKRLLVQTSEMDPGKQKHADSGVRDWFSKCVVKRNEDLGVFFKEKDKAFQDAPIQLKSLQQKFEKLKFEVPKIENILGGPGKGETLDDTLNRLIQQQEMDFKVVCIYSYPHPHTMEFGKSIGGGNNHSPVVIESRLFIINNHIRKSIQLGLDEYEKKHKDYKERKSYPAWLSILDLIKLNPNGYYYQDLISIFREYAWNDKSANTLILRRLKSSEDLNGNNAEGMKWLNKYYGAEILSEAWGGEIYKLNEHQSAIEELNASIEALKRKRENLERKKGRYLDAYNKAMGNNALIAKIGKCENLIEKFDACVPDDLTDQSFNYAVRFIHSSSSQLQEWRESFQFFNAASQSIKDKYQSSLKALESKIKLTVVNLSNRVSSEIDSHIEECDVISNIEDFEDLIKAVKHTYGKIVYWSEGDNKPNSSPQIQICHREQIESLKSKYDNLLFCLQNVYERIINRKIEEDSQKLDEEIKVIESKLQESGVCLDQVARNFLEEIKTKYENVKRDSNDHLNGPYMKNQKYGDIGVFEKGIEQVKAYKKDLIDFADEKMNLLNEKKSWSRDIVNWIKERLAAVRSFFSRSSKPYISSRKAVRDTLNGCVNFFQHPNNSQAALKASPEGTAAPTHCSKL